MAAASFKVEFPRRQAMLSIRERQEVKRPEIPSEPIFAFEPIFEYVEVARVPVLVWPMPTSEGLFVVEHQDGTVQMVQPDSLTFLGSKELFDQCSWEEA